MVKLVRAVIAGMTLIALLTVRTVGEMKLF
jgi:hypothetical protein